MEAHIKQLLIQSLTNLEHNQVLPKGLVSQIKLERVKSRLHGDFATNIAMLACKASQIKPVDLAELIVDNLPVSEFITSVGIAGGGFINFTVSSSWISTIIEASLRCPRVGVDSVKTSQTVVVDFSSPNLAKHMHVGHLRSTVIGDVVANCLAFLGHNVIRQNHVGDWGTQFGMLLAYIEELKIDRAQLSSNLTDLELFYRAAKTRFDESITFADRSRKLVVDLQSGNEHSNKLWQTLYNASMSHCQYIYDKLGVNLTPDDVRGESFYKNNLNQVISAIESKGLLTDDHGAKCVFLDELQNQHGEPQPVIVKKAGGGFLYATTDLAALSYRQNILNANRILYFVDSRQTLHFEQIFAIARAVKFVKESTSLEHMPFGTVMGVDGKPFRTRSGDVIKLTDLITEAEHRAYEMVKAKNLNMDEYELRNISETIGIASIKYADLSKNRTSDYIFSFDKMLRFEGNTATYLLYTHARIANIINRADIGVGLDGKVFLEHETELDLGRKLIQFSEAVSRVTKKGSPHLLCNYLFELASLFSSFYAACPIVNADNSERYISRLKLSQLTAKTLKQGLSLLGIKALDRM